MEPRIVFLKTAIMVIDMPKDFILAGAPMESAMGRRLVPKLADFLTP